MPVQRQQKITSLFQQSESQKATSETAKPKTKLKKPTSASVKTDIVISIKVQHMDNIVSRVKNHEFRKYNIPSIVERMWYVDIIKSCWILGAQLVAIGFMYRLQTKHYVTSL